MRSALARELYGIGIDTTTRLKAAFRLLNKHRNKLTAEECMQLITEAWENSDLVWRQLTRYQWNKIKRYKLLAVGANQPWMWPKDRPSHGIGVASIQNTQ
jgi:hypothetical protein